MQNLQSFQSIRSFANKPNPASYPFALQFNGSTNYVSLGTLGNLGSNLGSGFYCKFDIKTTSTSQGIFGYSTGSNQIIEVGLNTNAAWTDVANHGLTIYLNANNNLLLSGGTSAPTINFNDGATHTIIFTATPATNTITLSIDGVNQTVAYGGQQTPSTFVNFSSNFFIGARNNVGSPNLFLACTLDNFRIGTSSSNIYGSYLFNEGKGTITADSSGNGNNGTLAGSPLPSWVAGL